MIPLKIRGFFWNIRIHELKTSYGNENADQTFYIIGRNFNAKGGLFHIVYGATLHIHYALSKGYVPVIDLQNNHTQYLDFMPLGKENAWEYYFEQPCGIGLEHIKRSKNIIVCAHHYAPAGYYAYSTISNLNNKYFKSDIFVAIKNTFNRHIQLKAETLCFLDANYEKIAKGKRICGVLARGTDYTIIKPKNHPVQPAVLQLIEKIKNVMYDYACDFVYLATEDEEIFEKLKIEFGDQLLTNEQQRFRLNNELEDEEQYLSNFRTGLEREKYRMGLDYLCSIYILSKAQCFVGGMNNGTIGVMLMTQGFEYEYVFDLGYYK